MALTRPSAELAQKTNVNPVINRSTEATAQDFGEISALLNEYADLLELISNSNYRADFLGYFSSLTLLQSNFPNPPENSFAIIVDNANNPVEIYRFISGAYQAVTASENILFYSQRSSFPSTGEPGKLYIAKGERKIYSWYDNAYNYLGSFEFTIDQQLDANSGNPVRNSAIYSEIQTLLGLIDDASGASETTETFTYQGGSQIFTTQNEYSNMNIFRNGVLLADPAQYNLYPTAKYVEILDNLNNNEIITLKYTAQ